MKRKRLVITGLGAVCPSGNSVPELWNSLSNGRSGIDTLPEPLLSELSDNPTKYGGVVKNLQPETFLEKKLLRKMDKLSIYTTKAAIECVESSCMKLNQSKRYRCGCVMGVGIGGMESYNNGVIAYKDRGWKSIPVMTISKIIPNSTNSNIALHFPYLNGINYSVNTACSSSSDAIAAAARHILLDEADFMLAGGAETSLTGFGVSSFNVLHALSTKWSHDPTKASRPFDKDRDGFVMSEGAAVIALESLEHAEQRNAPILAELVGFANTNDGYHYTAPDPDAHGIVRAMHCALEQAAIDPSAIDYINAHGTSTPTNDPLETQAIKKVFKEYAYTVKISSTKSMTGHCVGATGAIEAIACIKAIEKQFLPPTINLDTPDTDCDLDYIPHKGIAHKVEYAMSNTLGFGGHNSVLIFKSYQQ
ncbi:3-oxoacyl-[acyl-carrier-protein] synthase 2-like [Ylistrum balloti]|uniref:3-oxoacyl-[acyl-carrier-protein] synthase 2-like n=1 Tax=Ylistrum balloti TaxID=509963 RepID=UPI002905C372|nr:3-oxoacyl-[acyl-carrier-protein] synthase 2-like [Ylistrum balloti]